MNEFTHADDSLTQAGDESNEVSFLDLLIVLARHKIAIFVVPFVCGVISVLLSLTAPNIFTAIAKILPPQQAQSTSSALLGQLGALTGSTALALKNPNDIYVAMLQSRTIVDSLIARFDLKKRWQQQYDYSTRNTLLGKTNVAAGKDGIITIEVDDQDPKFAAELANAYIEELQKLMESFAVTEASQRRLFFEKQLKLQKESLTLAEAGLREIQQKTGLIRVDDQSRAIIENIARTRAQVSAKEVQLRAMRTFATENNPEYLRTEQELAELRLQLARAEKDPRAEVGGTFMPSGRIPELGLELARRMRDVKYHETVYELLAKQFEIAKIDEAKESSMVQVLDKAVPPERKSKPHRARSAIITMLVMGFLGVIWAFLYEAYDRARRNPLQYRRLMLLREAIIKR